MIVATFDLSSACIGATFAKLDGTRITYASTVPIVPREPKPTDFGYVSNTKKKIQKGAATYQAFLYPDEKIVSKEEADRRTSEMKNLRHNYMLRDIGDQVGRYIGKIRPHIVAIEQNMAFGGILTTKLLAEIAGGLYFYCGASGIPIRDYNVSTVRARIRQDIKEFSFENHRGEVSLDTKWEILCRLRAYFEKEAPGMFKFDTMTLDESDSVAVFYYLLQQIREGKL